MKKITILIIHILLSFLSFFIPKKKGLYIFGSGNGKGFQGNPKYLLLYFLRENKSNHNIFWSTECDRTFTFLREKNIPVIKKLTFKSFLLFLRAEYFFIEKGPDDVYYVANILGRFNFIQTWHGIALKHVGEDAILHHKKGIRYHILTKPLLNKISKKLKLFSQQRYDLICSTSDFTKNILITSFKNKNVVNTGYPRNDILFNKDLSVERLDLKYNLKRFDKIWLYAPTYRDNYTNVKPFSVDGWQQMNTILKEKNYALIIKKHPLELNLDVSIKSEHIIDVSNDVFDIQEILIHCDGLISDYSSIASDFSLVNKPIIFFIYDLEEYSIKCRGFYSNPLEIFPGPFVYHTKDLIHHMFQLNDWFNQPDYQVKYKNYQLLYNQFIDGSSTHRLLNALKIESNQTKS